MNSRVSEINKVAFQERFKKINADCDKRSVWDCIDRPIRPLVFELARVGMIPKFSCCGYSYENEEEPKTHHGKFAYVFFYAPVKYFNEFQSVCDLAHTKSWGIHAFSGAIWHLHASNPVPDDLYKKEDGIPEAIHQYEGYGLKIEHLAGAIQENIPTVNETIEIVDGNLSYANFKTWIVKAKQNFKISVKDYYNEYGKIDYKGLNTSASERLGVDLITSENYEELKKASIRKVLA